MAIVRLDFVPAPIPDIVSLHIYEADNPDGPWQEIEVVTEVGSYPSYITAYTTTSATSETDWFAIDWYDSKGGNVGISSAVQGGTLTLVGDIVNRVLLRDATLNENVAVQEAEAVIEAYFGVDPYSLYADDATYVQKRGLTLAALARGWIFRMASGETESYTAGLVSQQTSATSASQNVELLLKEAEKALGISQSTILQMMNVETADGMATISDEDISRLLAEMA